LLAPARQVWQIRDFLPKLSIGWTMLTHWPICSAIVSIST
jgi:hypothetical protein